MLIREPSISKLESLRSNICVGGFERSTILEFSMVGGKDKAGILGLADVGAIVIGT